MPFHVKKDTSVKSIYIYGDYGADFRFMAQTVQNSFPSHRVKIVTKDDILNTEKFNPNHVTAFFMPGASNGQYDVRLGDDGFQAIRSYVEKGGIYAGFCAGVYYASHRFEWRMDDLEAKRIKEPSLRFFNGVSIGPITSLLAKNNPNWQWDDVCAVSIKANIKKTSDNLNVLYWGGPLMIKNALCKENFDVIATFNDLEGNPPCIISKTEGRGLVILSSVHPETTLGQLEPFAKGRHQKLALFKKLYDDLVLDENKRQNLWDHLMMKIKAHARRLHQNNKLKKPIIHPSNP